LSSASRGFQGVKGLKDYREENKRGDLNIQQCSLACAECKGCPPQSIVSIPAVPPSERKTGSLGIGRIAGNMDVDGYEIWSPGPYDNGLIKPSTVLCREIGLHNSKSNSKSNNKHNNKHSGGNASAVGKVKHKRSKWEVIFNAGDDDADDADVAAAATYTSSNTNTASNNTAANNTAPTSTTSTTTTSTTTTTTCTTTTTTTTTTNTSANRNQMKLDGIPSSSNPILSLHLELVPLIKSFTELHGINERLVLNTPVLIYTDLGCSVQVLHRDWTRYLCNVGVSANTSTVSSAGCVESCVLKCHYAHRKCRTKKEDDDYISGLVGEFPGWNVTVKYTNYGRRELCLIESAGKKFRSLASARKFRDDRDDRDDRDNVMKEVGGGYGEDGDRDDGGDDDNDDNDDDDDYHEDDIYDDDDNHYAIDEDDDNDRDNNVKSNQKKKKRNNNNNVNNNQNHNKINSVPPQDQIIDCCSDDDEKIRYESRKPTKDCEKKKKKKKKKR
jgi:hypothetical protein